MSAQKIMKRRGLTARLDEACTLLVSPSEKVAALSADERAEIKAYADVLRERFLPNPLQLAAAYGAGGHDVVVCDHTDADGNALTRFTKKYKVNGEPMYRLQCQGCGQSGSQISAKLLTDADKAEARDHLGWEDVRELPAHREADRRRAEHYENARAIREREREAEYLEWRERMQEYYASPYWRAFRRRIIERDGGTCQRCLDAPASDVHHLYDLHGMAAYDHVGDECAYLCVAVCRACHERIHGRAPSSANSASSAA